MIPMKSLAASLLTLSYTLGWASASNPVDADEFKAVAAILQTRCAGCHNDSDPKGDFSVQTQSSFFKDGHIERGASADSYLIELVTSEGDSRAEMPKTGPPLTSDEVQLISRWIDQGAQWPVDFQIEIPKPADFDWWSFKPLGQTEIPTFDDDRAMQWIRTPLDAFILKGLREQGMQPSEPADRRTLIRRVSFDLTGLPPTPEEIEAFVNDPDPEAYEALVDRLLASPHYGEHWARHWLDVVKYADTCGYDKDKLRPNAWPYRDYVIRSFNNDKPYDQFVQEQIAGDSLFPGQRDGILGLGFIAAGPWDFLGHVEVSEEKIDGQVARMLDRDEMVTNTINTFCSLTIQCARCHDHKFDPFTQADYYGLQAIFAAVDRAEREYEIDLPAYQHRARLDSRLARLEQKIESLESQVPQRESEQYAELQSEIMRLEQVQLAQGAAFGYHSQVTLDPETPKWVEVTLDEPADIKKLVLRPCYDDFAGIGAGFGFPVRFRIESDAGLIRDATHVDFENPGTAAVSIPVNRSVRRIRIVATRLAARQNDFILALGELELLDETGRNVALHAKVSALDTIESLPRWSQGNLVDGNWYGGGSSSKDELESARKRLQALMHQVLGDDRWDQLQQARRTRDEIADQIASLPRGRLVYAAATEFTEQGNFKPTRGRPRPVYVLHRGDVLSPREQARPALLPLDSTNDRLIPAKPDESHYRAELASWIADPDHPLTWRSIVNRIWQGHFGKGLVTTPNDFGRMGAAPSHPSLLDWLAADFRDQGATFKRLHRMIVTSNTYRQSSQSNDTYAAIDSGNRYLWRMNRRRLSAEEIRDTILSVSGKLDRTMGGPGFYLFALEKTEHSPHYEYHKFDHRDPTSYRRSVYRFVVRSQPDPFMTTLDCADSSQSTPTRGETYTALQSLTLLNSQFNLVMAEHFAGRLKDEAETTTARVRRGFELVAGRQPTDDELTLLVAHAEQHGLKNLCRVLMNLNEFVFVD